MSKIVWDKLGERTYETGVSHGVLYLQKSDGSYHNGVAWNGLTSVIENSSGGEPNSFYADNIKYLTLMSAEEAGLTIEAYSYPPEFAECDGKVEIAQGVTIGQQTRKPFGFSYRTKLGNDIYGDDYGYKLHLVYGAKVSPSEKSHSTINDSPEVIGYSWEVSMIPVSINGHRPTATFTIDSTKIISKKLKLLEDVLYGTDKNDPVLPNPNELINIFLSDMLLDSNLDILRDNFGNAIFDNKGSGN